jgi:hypothetical protein
VLCQPAHQSQTFLAAMSLHRYLYIARRPPGVPVLCGPAACLFAAVVSCLVDVQLATLELCAS